MLTYETTRDSRTCHHIFGLCSNTYLAPLLWLNIKSTSDSPVPATTSCISCTTFTGSLSSRANHYLIFLLAIVQLLPCLEASALAPSPVFSNRTDVSPFGAFAAFYAADARLSTLAGNPLEKRQDRICPYGPGGSKCHIFTVTWEIKFIYIFKNSAPMELVAALTEITVYSLLPCLILQSLSDWPFTLVFRHWWRLLSAILSRGYHSLSIILYLRFHG